MIAFIREKNSWMYFCNPSKILETYNINEVESLLSEASESGLYAAGFISYEASSAFDSAFINKKDFELPLLSIGLYKDKIIYDELPNFKKKNYKIGKLIPSVNKKTFLNKIKKIKLNIEAGNTYQVNYSYRLNGTFTGDTYEFFKYLINNQNASYASFISTNDWSICSASPELFFSLKSNILITKPMKGTTKRGKNLEEDIRESNLLKNSKKNQAENIMIVDMLRNDIGKIAKKGSVETVKTFELEKYPTLWQMTSTIKGHVSHKVPIIMKALFPCASITGAPKIKTMEIIENIENSAREIYTGTVGYITPCGDALFNVAIRTALINKKNKSISYGVGSGIVWDSIGEEEYEETQIKAKILLSKRYNFDLIETMLWKPKVGVNLLEYHIKRMKSSADFFGRGFNEEDALNLINSVSSSSILKLRLLLKQNELLILEKYPLKNIPKNKILKIKLASNQTNSSNLFLRHKTSIRDAYDNAKKDINDCDEVLLWNENDEVTEGTIYNIAIFKNNKWLTPPLDSGLLNGVMRQSMIDSGELEESKITINDVKKANKIKLFNSVQGSKEAILI